MRARTPQRGFALAGAIFGLVIIAALVAGAFYASRQELSIGRNSQNFQRAFEAAEAGMGRQIAMWNTSANALAVGDSVILPPDTLPGGSGISRSVVRRLNTQLYLIRTTGTSGNATRTLASLTRLQLLNMNIAASLTTRSSLKIGGSSFVDGRNTNPSGWACPLPTDTLPAVLTPDSNLISTSGCGGYNCLFGNPKIKQDPTVNDSTFFSFGQLDWAGLTAMANKIYNGNAGPLNTLAPIGAGSVCATGVQDNWGEPLRGAGTIAACYNYMPIIYVNGNLKITGGRGQGILLVEGDLSVQGGFEFFGPVIVRGHLETQGTGGHFNGGVMAANVDLELSTVLGDAVITYSSCAITRALQASAMGRGLRQRSWVELTQ